MSLENETLEQRIQALSPHQIDCIDQLVSALRLPVETYFRSGSSFADQRFVEEFSDLLRIHHFFSEESFTKDKFEFGMVRVLNRCGHVAVKGAYGHPGHDITVDKDPWSLKSQADKGIKREYIHISKFKELGKGNWATEADLEVLREGMFRHMENYNRIFTLRCLSASKKNTTRHNVEYELVEIPKQLLLLSNGLPCRMMTESTQSPKPGYCDVVNQDGRLLLQLYFDGGGERKLQIKGIRKQFCTVHAWWKFSLPPSPVA